MTDEQTVTELKDATTHAEQLEQAIASQIEDARREEREAIAIFLKSFADEAYSRSSIGTETLRTIHRASLLVRSGDYLACLGGDRL